MVNFYRGTPLNENRIFGQDNKKFIKVEKYSEVDTKIKADTN